MVKMIALKCPSCNSELIVEQNREQLFCQYCGTKILLKNENEYVVRQINEAEVIQAETERIVRLKQLEEADNNKTQNKRVNILILVIGIVMGILSLTLMIVGTILSGAIPEMKDAFETLAIVGMFIAVSTAAIIIFIKAPKKER